MVKDIVEARAVGPVTVTVSVCVQEAASVTVTVYVPAKRFVTDVVVAPKDHK